jgi:signal transduction histidine kinase
VDSYAVVPLASRGRVLGVLRIGVAGPARRLGAEDLALAEDVAGRISLAVDNGRLLRRSRAASRAKSAFLATMSRELRAPLDAILASTGAAESAAAGQPGAARITGPLSAVRRVVTHLRNLVEEILEFARLGTTRSTVAATEVDVGQLLLDAVAVVQPALAAKALRLELQVDRRLGRMTCDAAKVRRILVSLLDNAVKFTVHGGVTLAASVEDSRTVAFRVRDTGSGIPPDVLERILRPFSQVSRRRAPMAETGVGLSVCQSLANLLGGEIDVETQVGRGSTFTLRLPAQCRPAPPPG